MRVHLLLAIGLAFGVPVDETVVPLVVVGQ